MKKFLASFVLVLVLICAFATISYAANIYVNGQSYGNNLSTALTNAPNDGSLWKIELKADYSTGSGSYSPGSGKNIEIDLGGYTLKCTSANNPLFYVKSDFKIYNGKIEITGTGNVFNVNTAGGKLVLGENLEITTNSGNIAYCDTKECSVVINGGTYQKNSGTKLFTVKNSPLTINGGTFITTTTEETVFDDVIGLSTADGSAIKGGTFSVAVDEKYIANGYECVENEDGTYSVVEKIEVNNELSEVSYDDKKGTSTVTNRFFTTLESLDFAKAGFEVEAVVDDETYVWDIALDSVYNTVTVNGSKYVASAGYILTGAIGDVPSDFGSNFVVTPYVITYEGVKIPLA